MHDPSINNAWCLFDAAGNFKACLEFTAKLSTAVIYQKNLGSSFMCFLAGGPWVNVQTGSNYTVTAFQNISETTDTSAWNPAYATCGTLWTWFNETVGSTATTFTNSVLSCAYGALSSTCSAISEAAGIAEGVAEACVNSTAFQIANQTGFNLGYQEGFYGGFDYCVKQLGYSALTAAVDKAVAETTATAVKIAVPTGVLAVVTAVGITFFATRSCERNRQLQQSRVIELPSASENSAEDLLSALPTPTP